MCGKCDQYRLHIAILCEVRDKTPEYKEKIQRVIDFLMLEQDNYVDDAVERDMRD